MLQALRLAAVKIILLGKWFAKLLNFSPSNKTRWEREERHDHELRFMSFLPNSLILSDIWSFILNENNWFQIFDFATPLRNNNSTSMINRSEMLLISVS